jgi:hypothetical protein
MGPGHLGLGFAVKPTAEKVPLLLLLIASEMLDILSFIFEALGIERFAVMHMDFEHGLQTITPGYIPWSYTRYKKIPISAVIGILVFSY